MTERHEKDLIRQALDIVEEAAPSIAGVFLGPNAAEAARDIIAIADNVANTSPRPRHPALATKDGAERIAHHVAGLASVKEHARTEMLRARERHAGPDKPAFVRTERDLGGSSPRVDVHRE